MRLLLDQNLSPRLKSALHSTYPDPLHVRDVGLEAADDSDVWAYARTEGLVIVSKDSDFRQLSFLLGHPPKVVWIRRGNCTTEEIALLLIEHYAELEAFYGDQDGAFLALN